ncbi:rho gtpase-activating protein gacr [Anaeramoeba flamelloides]|uniref:Rho gtpase-activating protein gacr n=1 Tax=Anaeramoeba flamelloides TaxID=1746091 RepID=A0AAV7Y1M3_9EUKA|nr:rho gtpase-activating protein gacr [Anaeramoeba flamelloides]
MSQFSEQLEDFKTPSAFTQVFGARLSNLLPVHPFIQRCIDFIYKWGLDKKGIFRLAPKKSLIGEIIDKVNSGQLVDIEQYDIVTAASLIKLYLRMLPEPLLTNKLYDNFINVLNLKEEDQVPEFCKLTSQLPISHKILFIKIFDLLTEIDWHSENNLMGFSNLSTFFGPAILPFDLKETNPQLVFEASTKIIKIGFLLLTNYSSIKKYFFQQSEEEEEEEKKKSIFTKSQKEEITNEKYEEQQEDKNEDEDEDEFEQQEKENSRFLTSFKYVFDNYSFNQSDDNNFDLNQNKNFIQTLQERSKLSQNRASGFGVEVGDFKYILDSYNQQIMYYRGYDQQLTKQFEDSLPRQNGIDEETKNKLTMETQQAIKNLKNKTDLQKVKYKEISTEKKNQYNNLKEIETIFKKQTKSIKSFKSLIKKKKLEISKELSISNEYEKLTKEKIKSLETEKKYLIETCKSLELENQKIALYTCQFQKLHTNLESNFNYIRNLKEKEEKNLLNILIQSSLSEKMLQQQKMKFENLTNVLLKEKELNSLQNLKYASSISILEKNKINQNQSKMENLKKKIKLKNKIKDLNQNNKILTQAIDSIEKKLIQQQKQITLLQEKIIHSENKKK